MKKRLLTALICLWMALTLLPTTAMAAPATSVQVLMTEVAGGGYWKVNARGEALETATSANYSVRYDVAEHKLYLRNLSLDFTRDSSWYYDCHLISANGDLHMVWRAQTIFP